MSAGVVVRRLLTTALTMLAFWNSYTHTVDWFEAHGQTDAANILALIPEAGLILALLFLASGQLSTLQRWLVGLVGCGSIGITIAANLAGASQGSSGKVAALVAPVFAILGFALEITGPGKTVGADHSVQETGPLARTAEPGTGPVRRSTQPRSTRTASPVRSVPDREDQPAVDHPHPGPAAVVRETGPVGSPRRTDAEVLTEIRGLIAAGLLHPEPSATRLAQLPQLGIGKGRALRLAPQIPATQADTPTRTLAG